MPQGVSRDCGCGIYKRQSRDDHSDFSPCDGQFAACFEFIRASFHEGRVCHGRQTATERIESQNERQLRRRIELSRQ